jgi:RecA/RadA recombinase
MNLLEKLNKKKHKIKSNLISLDLACLGGIEAGSSNEIYGPSDIGKTSLALQFCKTVTNNNGIAFYINLEGPLQKTILGNRGINKDRIFFCNCGTKELPDILSEVFDSNPPDLLVLDSLAAFTPENETLDSEFRYKLLRKIIRQLNSIVIEHEIALLVLNQEREKIGGPPITVGGRSVCEWVDKRIKLRSKDAINTDYVRTGTLIEFEVEDKFINENKVAEASLFYSSGFNEELCLLDTALSLEVVNRVGGYYFFEDINLGKGRYLASKSIKGDLKQSLIEKVYKKGN